MKSRLSDPLKENIDLVIAIVNGDTPATPTSDVIFDSKFGMLLPETNSIFAPPDIVMRIKLLLLTMWLVMGTPSMAQINLDSLVLAKRTDKLEGKLPTFYTPGYQDIARDFQTIITDAIAYYESKYGVQFQVKMMVLDSAQWLNEVYPYGFVFHTNGWIGMNTGMNYEKFKRVYGLHTYYQHLDKELKKLKISETKMINAFFKFYSIHELGHYFFEKISKAKSPDNWMDEVSASYFSYEYFRNRHDKTLKVFELFCRVDRDHYSPTYSSIADFNEKYDKTGLENYLWYHSNFYFLVQTLYGCFGERFMSAYETGFPGSDPGNYTTEEIINYLDGPCKGQVHQWVSGLEAKTKR